MSNGNLYRGYPSIVQGVDAGREILSLIRTGTFADDIKHSVAVCDTVAGAIAGVYPGAPDSVEVPATSLSLEQKKVFDDLLTEATALVKTTETKQGSSMAEATKTGAGAVPTAFDPTPWLPYLNIIIELLRQWLNKPRA